MPKATVTIDLPDGWELADTTMRKAKPGEYRWLPAVGKPYRLESASEGECFIVRRIADQYVNVKLRRDVAAAVLHQFVVDGSTIGQVTAACREALSERCGAQFSDFVAGKWLADFTCTLPAGHAGEHGV